MATSVRQYQVDITSNPNVIIVTAEPIASNISEAFPVAHILQVTPIFFDYSNVEAGDTGDNFKETYPYATMTRMIIESHDGKKLDIECQSVTNQATWSTGLQSGLAAAIADITTML